MSARERGGYGVDDEDDESDPATEGGGGRGNRPGDTTPGTPDDPDPGGSDDDDDPDSSPGPSTGGGEPSFPGGSDPGTPDDDDDDDPDPSPGPSTGGGEPSFPGGSDPGTPDDDDDGDASPGPSTGGGEPSFPGGTAPGSDGDDDPNTGGSNNPVAGVVDDIGTTVGGVTDRVGGVVDDITDSVSGAASGASNRIDDVTSGVGDTVDNVGSTIDDVQDTVSGGVDNVSDTVDDVTTGAGTAVDDVQETVDDVTDDVQTGVSDTAADVSAGVGGVAADVSTGVDDVASDVSAGVDDTAEYVAGRGSQFVDDATQDIDTDITDDLTTGGFLSEDAESDGGFLSGSYTGVTPEGEASVDVSEEAFRERAEANQQAAEEAFGSNPELTIGGSNVPDRVITGAAESAADVANVPGLVLSGETATEVAQNAPGEIREEGARDVAETVLGVGAAAGAATVKSARENPAEFAGGAAFNLIGGAAAGRQLGTVGRSLRDRARTRGSERVSANELASDDVVRYSETDGAEGTRFPGASDETLLREDPAEAIRQQADEFTPEVITDVFDDADVEGDTTLFKALDVNPEGPERGRGNTGFESAPGETLEDFDYETPGSFFGPELSPNFLGVDDGAGFSLRPGLPDTGNNPTAVAARTDVENPDADTLDEFNRELIGRSGETTARPKPAGEVNPGEAEAVVPPGSRFRSVDADGGVFTEISGRRVPIQTVAPEQRRRGDADTDTDVPAADADTARGRSLDEISERVEQPTDRPLAGFGVGRSSAAGGSSSSGGSATDPFSFGGGSSGGSGSDTDRGSSGGSSSAGGSGSSGGSSSSSGTPSAPSTTVTSVDDLLGGGTSVGETSLTRDRTTTSTPTSTTDVPTSTSTPSSARETTSIGGSSIIDRGGSDTLTPSDPPSLSPPSQPPSQPPTEPGTPPGTPGTPPTNEPTRPPETPEGDDERDVFTFAVDQEGREFGSGLLSGDAAIDRVFGRER